MSVSGDVVFFGLDSKDKPVMLKADTELFRDSLKYIDAFKLSMRRDCRRTWRFLSKFFENSKTPKGLLEQMPDLVLVTGVYEIGDLSNLVMWIQSVLSDDSFREELNQEYERWYEGQITYRDRMLGYYYELSVLLCTMNSYLRLLEIRDAENKIFIDNVPKFILDSEAIFDNKFYVVLYNA